MFFDKANVKRKEVLIKYRHEIFIIFFEKFYLTIGAWGADRSSIVIVEFSGRDINAK